MRCVILAILLALASPATASTFEIPFNVFVDAPYEYDGRIFIFGPFADRNTEYFAQFQVTLPTFNLGFDPTQSGANNVYGQVGVADSDHFFTFCETTAPGPCGNNPGPGIESPVGFSATTNSIRYSYFVIPFGDIEISGTPQFFVTLPEGFVVSVPEASTWAMMILGFSGIGFLTYRRRYGNRPSAP
jgi:hypothetical protein